MSPPAGGAKKASTADKAHYKVSWVREGHNPESFRELSGVAGGGVYTSSNGKMTAAKKAAREIFKKLHAGESKELLKRAGVNSTHIHKVHFQIEIINRDNKFAARRGWKYVFKATWTDKMTAKKDFKTADGKPIRIRPVNVIDVEHIKGQDEKPDKRRGSAK